MQKSNIIFVILWILSGMDAGAQIIPENNTRPIYLEAIYTGDNLVNHAGGIRTGYAYLGMASLFLTFDVEKAGLWKNGILSLHGANTHGATPSADLLGDIQIASNIEAGNHTYLQELWFQQTFGEVSLTIGLQDLNVEFARSDNGSMYLNSSFGIIPIISANFPAPIFPLTTPGVMVKWDVNSRTAWLNAIYDGSPTDFNYNPYNINWEFATGDGMLAISELQRRIEHNRLPGTYKLGFYVHAHIIKNTLKENLPDSPGFSTFAAYIHADQTIWAGAGKSLNLFMQTGYSPSIASINNYYLGLGINGCGLLSQKNNDVLGLAFAHADFSNIPVKETVIELTWQKFIGKHVFLQSDVQYIINPAGLNRTIKNSLVTILRFGISITPKVKPGTNDY